MNTNLTFKNVYDEEAINDWSQNLEDDGVSVLVKYNQSKKTFFVSK